MKLNITRISFGAASLVIACSTLIALPVYAEDGSTGSSDDGTTTNTSSPSVSPKPSTSESPEAESDNPGALPGNPKLRDDEDGFKKGGQVFLTVLGRTFHKHTEAQKLKFCTEHKQGLTNAFNRINGNLAAYQMRIDGILTKVQDYQKANNITVSNWSTLLAAATSAQTTSQNALTALKGVTPTIDCNSTTTAANIATFRTGAKQARDDLKAYRNAVRVLIQALLAANP
jgi:hypothetical protein